MAAFGDIFGVLSQIGGATAKFIPESVYFRAERKLAYFLANDGLSQNHDLVRAVRFAWTEAAKTVAEHTLKLLKQKPNGDDDQETINFCNILKDECKKIHANAANQDRNEDLIDSKIDESAKMVLTGLAKYVGGDHYKDYETEINNQLIGALSSLTNWPENEIPGQFITVAKSGLGNSDNTRRSFGLLVIHGLGEIIKSDKYPEAKSAYGTYLYNATINVLEEQREKLVDLHVDVQEILQRLNPQAVEAVIFKRAIDLAAEKERQFPALPQNPVLLFCHGDNAVWTRDVSEAFDKALTRNNAIGAANLYEWNIEKFEAVTSDMSAETLATWIEGFPGLADKSQALATLVDLRNSHGPVLPGTVELWNKLHNYGLLADKDNPGITEEWPQTPAKQAAALRNGKVPLSVLTQVCAQAVMAGRPLVLCYDSKDVCPETGALLELFGAKATKVDTTGLSTGNEWLKTLLFEAGIVERSEINPFRFLEYYDIEDSNCYFGRDDESEQVRNMVLSDDTPIIGITGISGSGKSSFLRAGVIGRLDQNQAMCVVLRSTDFLLGPDGTLRTLADSLLAIGEKTHTRIPENLMAKLKSTKSDTNKKVVIDEIQKQRKGALSKLVICIDQFEEIIDDLYDKKHQSEWRALIDVLVALTKNNTCKLLFTLEDTRCKRFKSLAANLGLQDVELVDIPPIDDAFLRTVIKELFAIKGIEIANDVADPLVESVLHPKQKQFRGSMIPLLSFKLSKIYERLQTEAAQKKKGSKSRTDFDKAASFKRINKNLLDELDIKTDLISEIHKLAEDTWKKTSPLKDEHIGVFLRPYIRVSSQENGENGANITLNSSQKRAFSADDTLDAAFMDARLLVPMGSGQRLVHEIVIHEWERAREWFENEKQELLIEERFRARAQLWHDDGRNSDAVWKDQENIENAAVILGNWMRNWAAEGHVINDEKDANLKDYCLEVFKNDRSPCTKLRNAKKGNRHVHIAASFGLLDLLKTYHKIDKNSLFMKRSDGISTLHQAAFSHLNTAAYLLDQGLDPHVPDKDGHTALSAPSFDKRMDIFELLIAKTDPDKFDSNDIINPIGVFASTCCYEMLTKTVERGFDPNSKGKIGRLGLFDAVRWGDEKAFEYLLGRTTRTDIPVDGKNIAHCAADSGNAAILHKITCNPDFAKIICATDSNYNTPLMIAAMRQQADCIETLLYTDNLEQRNKDGKTALHLAISPIFGPKMRIGWRTKMATRKAVAALLENASLDVNARLKSGESPFLMATADPVLQKMLQGHVMFDPLSREKNAWSKIMVAARAGDLDQVNRLLDLADADLKHVGIDGNSVMNCLAKGKLFDVFTKLWDAGQIDPWDAQAQKSILLADIIRVRDKQLVHRVLDAAPQTVKKPMLQSALNQVVAVGADLSIFEKLIKLGAEPTKELLASSVRLSRFEHCRFMLEYGVDTEVENTFGLPLYELAPDSAINDFKALFDSQPKRNLALFNAAQKGDETAFLMELEASSFLELRKPDDFGRYPYDLVPDALRPVFKKMFDDELKKKEP